MKVQEENITVGFSVQDNTNTIGFPAVQSSTNTIGFPFVQTATLTVAAGVTWIVGSGFWNDDLTWVDTELWID